MARHKSIRVSDWERAKFVAEQFIQFRSSPEIRQVLAVLDDRKPQNRSKDEMLLRVLSTDDKLELSNEELQLRSCFDIFLNFLEQINRYVEIGLFSIKDLDLYLRYWIDIIGSKDFSHQGLRFYRQLSNYIDFYDYAGVQNLFNQFKKPIPPYGGFRFDTSHLDPAMACGYSPDHTVSLAQASALSYENPAYVGLVVMEEWKFDGFKFLKGDFFEKEKVDTQAFIAWRGDVVVLAFRGTKEITDWLTNIDRHLEPLYINKRLAKRIDPTATGKVHRGFQAAWLSIADKVVHYLDMLEREHPRCVFITGHSLGGALANMATAHLLAQGWTVNALYTFGQPRIGNCAFADWFDSRFKKATFRYVNRNDIVPRVPLSSIPRYIGWRPFYQHAGNMMYLDTEGRLRSKVTITEWFKAQFKIISDGGFSWIDDHDISRYTRFVRYTASQHRSLSEVKEFAQGIFPLSEAGDKVATTLKIKT